MWEWVSGKSISSSPLDESKINWRIHHINNKRYNNNNGDVNKSFDDIEVINTFDKHYLPNISNFPLQSLYKLLSLDDSETSKRIFQTLMMMISDHADQLQRTFDEKEELLIMDKTQLENELLLVQVQNDLLSKQIVLLKQQQQALSESTLLSASSASTTPPETPTSNSNDNSGDFDEDNINFYISTPAYNATAKTTPTVVTTGKNVTPRSSNSNSHHKYTPSLNLVELQSSTPQKHQMSTMSARLADLEYKYDDLQHEYHKVYHELDHIKQQQQKQQSIDSNNVTTCNSSINDKVKSHIPFDSTSSPMSLSCTKDDKHSLNDTSNRSSVNNVQSPVLISPLSPSSSSYVDSSLAVEFSGSDAHSSGNQSNSNSNTTPPPPPYDKYFTPATAAAKLFLYTPYTRTSRISNANASATSYYSPRITAGVLTWSEVDRIVHSFPRLDESSDDEKSDDDNDGDNTHNHTHTNSNTSSLHCSYKKQPHTISSSGGDSVVVDDIQNATSSMSNSNIIEQNFDHLFESITAVSRRHSLLSQYSATAEGGATRRNSMHSEYSEHASNGSNGTGAAVEEEVDVLRQIQHRLTRRLSEIRKDVRKDDPSLLQHPPPPSLSSLPSSTVTTPFTSSSTPPPLLPTAGLTLIEQTLLSRQVDELKIHMNAKDVEIALLNEKLLLLNSWENKQKQHKSNSRIRNGKDGNNMTMMMEQPIVVDLKTIK